MFRKLFTILVLAAADVVLLSALVAFVPLPNKFDVQIKLHSAVLAHWSLLTFWLSFGGTRAPWRQIICTGVLVLLCMGAAPVNGDRLDWVYIASLQIIGVTWFAYAAAFFPRKLVGYQIGFARRGASKRQFGLGVTLEFLVVFSIPLALFWMAFSTSAPGAGEFLLMLLNIIIPIWLTLLPLAFAIFARRRALLKIATSLGWCLLLTGLLWQFGQRLGYGKEIALMHIFVWTQVGLILMVARALGLQWEKSTVQGCPTTSASGNRP